MKCKKIKNFTYEAGSRTTERKAYYRTEYLSCTFQNVCIYINN